MDIEAYLRAVEQRSTLRRQINSQLTALRGTHNSLKVAAGNIAASQPTLVIGPDPLAQVGPLLGEAASLSSRLGQNASQVATLEKALVEAEAAAQASRVRRVGIAIALLIGLLLYLYFKH